MRKRSRSRGRDEGGREEKKERKKKRYRDDWKWNIQKFEQEKMTKTETKISSMQ